MALTNAGRGPVQCTAAELFLTGKKPDEATIAQAAALSAKAASPSADWRGSEEYKREMARIMTMRALTTAVERAGGN
jgi:carbon-monoxide dehydrogenase medium subunit